jgi:nucleotide-binding universal stress UspA family protein
MADIRRILCPVDFSDASQHALDHAVMIAGWYRARITAFHVRHPILVPEPPVLFAEAGADSFSVEDLEARLHHWLAPVRAAGISCDVMVVDAPSPASRIVDAAPRLGIDLIVMGTHGRGGFERLILGSVTERVVRRAECPVITVPPPGVTTSTLPFKRILCAVDFSEPSIAAMRYALSLARESNSTLSLLHAIEFPLETTPFETMSFDMSAYRAAVREDATRRLVQLLSDELPAPPRPAVTIVHGKAYEQIIATASALQADLIVLGVHGRNTLDLMLFGSTTNQVIRHATCPVLTLRRRTA